MVALSSLPLVGFCGSRALAAPGPVWVRSLARGLAAAGVTVASGCALGADAASLAGARAAGASPVVFAVGSASGVGFPGLGGVPSAVAALPPSAVRWLAGGPLSVPLAARLASRSLAFVRFVAASGGALVAAVSSLPSRPFGRGPFPSCGSGSWSSVAAAVLLGVPVFVAPFGVAPSAFPSLPGGGSWLPGSLRGVPCWSWSPAAVAVALPGFGCA